MTGWTVIYQDKLSQLIEVFVDSVSYINTTRCGKLPCYLYDNSEMNTHCMVSFLLISNVFLSCLPCRGSLCSRPSFASLKGATIPLSRSGYAAKGGRGLNTGKRVKPEVVAPVRGPQQRLRGLLLLPVLLRLRWATTSKGSQSKGKKANNIRANKVKKSLTWGQSAWITKNSISNPSETTRSASQKSQSYAFKDNTKKSFYQWLVGVTDGDGTFHFSKTKKGIWSFTFKIGQSNYNLRLLYYIKSMLGIGSVSNPNSKDNTAEFRIRNIQHIILFILPIFETYPLLTSKYFYYKLFRESILIMNDSTLSKEEKDKQISHLKSQTMPDNYISPA
jgi:LAGLIDADG endonuclease